MKKFNFRLAGYLRIKEFEEKSAWNEVLKQEARISLLKNKIDNLNNSVHVNRAGLSQTGTQGSDIGRWQLIEESIVGMTAQVALLEQEYQLEAKVLDKLVARHREAKKEAKTVENFKDRKKAEFKEEKTKQADIQRQEFSMQAHIRKVK